MASIDERPDGQYPAPWREYPVGPQKVRHFTRKRDAEQFLDAIRDLAHGMYVDPAGGWTLFRRYADRWRSVQVHRTGTTTQETGTQLSGPRKPPVAESYGTPLPRTTDENGFILERIRVPARCGGVRSGRASLGDLFHSRQLMNVAKAGS